jgi:hypothetical protein
MLARKAETGMHLPHQQCDLSLRRVVNPSNNTFDRVAANSLEDLASRQNRFAHAEFILQNNNGNITTSMPLLVLENAYTFATGPAPVRNSILNNQIPGSGNLNGPLHAAFVLQDRSDPSLVLHNEAGNLFYGNRIGEDVIASFCLGFDLQAYDPLVPVLYLPGADGTLSGGAAGTDDIIVSPSDPGYAAAMVNSFSNSNVLAGAGAYVNLGWARHVFNEVSTATGLANDMAVSSIAFESPFSGISIAQLKSGSPFADSLYRSGLVFQGLSSPQWGQMSYDTWTTAYEVDGLLQTDRTRLNATTRYSGTLQQNFAVTGSWRQVADAGRDGIDNDLNGGADNPEEWETSPPFPYPLRSVRALIRLEEPDTRQLFQQNVTVEFVSR